MDLAPLAVGVGVRGWCLDGGYARWEWGSGCCVVSVSGIGAVIPNLIEILGISA
jgi:hypothetical protein